MPHVYPNRITQARDLLGLSKTNVADGLSVSPAAVAQWESGVKTPTAENLAELSSFLQVPMPFFLTPKPYEVAHHGPLTFRAQSDAKTRRTNRKAHSYAELTAEIYFWLLSKIDFPDPKLPELGKSGQLDMEAIASETRKFWGLTNKPIIKLGELIEYNGILIIYNNFCDERIDAFSCIIGGRPIIFLGGDKKDKARSQFDAAHELGHLILHQHYSDNDLRDPVIHKTVEGQANAFAAAFLLPEESFLTDIMDISLDGFLKLKTKWGVSAQSMIFRAHQLNAIDDGYYRELFRNMSVSGWRKARGEPLDEIMPGVNATLRKGSFDLLEKNKIISAWQLPAELPMPHGVLAAFFDIEPTALEPPQTSNIINIKSFLNAPFSHGEILHEG